MKKRHLSALLLSILLISTLFLSGCGGGEQSSPSEKSLSEAQTFEINAPANLGGGLRAKFEVNDPESVDTEQKEKFDRAIRAYNGPDGEPLLKNDANEFIYYSMLDDMSARIYDAILIVAEDPVNENNIGEIGTVDEGVTAADLEACYNKAYMSVIYDHPELFWLYNGSMGYSVNLCLYQEGDDISLYMKMNKPYTNFEKDMTAFNDAAEEFLSDIDTSDSKVDIAIAIHDKLIETVSYDYQVAEEESLNNDIAHTAYGALVANGRGEAHKAVCDGYSLAYEYLLQQSGIDAVVMLGKGGESEADAEGHAWNVIRLDDEWYEVDTTWDDAGGWKESLEDQKDSVGPDVYDAFSEAIYDDNYFDKIQHYMYCVSSDTISHYIPVSDYDYQTSNNYVINLTNEGVHIRASELSDMPVYNDITSTIPTASKSLY